MSKSLIGVVANDTCSNTISVVVYSKVWAKLYRKLVRSKKKYLVHDEGNKCCVGDRVMIKPSVPLSARKRWVIVDG